MTTDEERAKLYHAQRDAEELCELAHYSLETYLRAIGKAARLDMNVAINQVERDIGLSDDRIVRELGGGQAKEDYVNIVTRLVERGVNLSKRDEESGLPIPSASGYRTDGEGTTLVWAVFNIKDLPSDIDVDSDSGEPHWVGEGNLAYQLTGWFRYARGPGLPFATEPWYIKGRTRILVKQQRGLDI